MIYTFALVGFRRLQSKRINARAGKIVWSRGRDLRRHARSRECGMKRPGWQRTSTNDPLTIVASLSFFLSFLSARCCNARERQGGVEKKRERKRAGQREGKIETGNKGMSGKRRLGWKPPQSRHSRNDFVLRACLIMNPHPVEAPPPFARHHRLCKRLEGVGAPAENQRGWRQSCFRGS